MQDGERFVHRHEFSLHDTQDKACFSRIDESVFHGVIHTNNKIVVKVVKVKMTMTKMTADCVLSASPK